MDASFTMKIAIKGPLKWIEKTIFFRQLVGQVNQFISDKIIWADSVAVNHME